MTSRKRGGGSDRNTLAAAFSALERIYQSLDLDVVLLTTVSEVRQLLQVERVFLFRLESHWSGVVVEECALGCLPLQDQQAYDDCFAERWVSAYAQGRVQAVGDIEEAELTPCHRDLLRGLGVAQHCSVPLPWQPTEVQMIQQLAVQVGLAIQPSERYQQMQAELTTRRQAEAQLLQQAQRSRDRHLESAEHPSPGMPPDPGVAQGIIYPRLRFFLIAKAAFTD